jgi:serine/threonine-protein kinase
MSADRNLLFGILALQMDFVSRDALVRGMNAWVLEKGRPLGDLLQEQGALSAEHHALLEAMVQAHLKAHDNDPQRSLAAVSSVGSVRRDLEQITDSDLHATLSRVSADPYSTRAESAGTPTSSGLRFRVLRPHARGGLGEVFVARDEELHREVALKEIQSQHADHPESRSRFLLEAEVTGGLEHPGIVPVYGLGHYPDGRPFYAMRFIRGDSLQEAVKRFHARRGERSPRERALELRRLLGRFVDVCQAVAYAHSRGVLHRDLKPGNVMLGRYGETLVVDWGLAKPLGQAEPTGGSEEGPLRPASASGSAATQLGSAIGTPAFMSPEQAAGRLDQLGPASDVYGLGATLYALLTGRAPFAGDGAGQVLSRVQKGDFPPPRQVDLGVPAALEAVCLKAMALRSEDRYSSAQALAQDVERWLADEPVSAWREPWRVQAGRWARRHQTAVTATAAAVLVALLLGGGGAFLFERQWAERRAEQARQEAQLRQGIEAALADVARLQGQARWGEARAVVTQAASRLGEEGPQDLRVQVQRAREDLDLVARLDAIRLSKASWVEGAFDYEGADRGYAAAFAEGGLATEGDDPTAAANRVRASAVRGALVAALDDWASSTRDARRRAWLLELARKADPDPWRDRARQPAVWRDRQALKELVAEEEATDQSPQLVVALAVRLRSDEAAGLLRQALARHPDDFWLSFELGHQLAKEEPAEAAGYYRAALALRPGSVVVCNNLGNALRTQARWTEAEQQLRAAIYLDRKFALPHNNLGDVLYGQGRREEAAEELRAAIRLDPKYASPHNNLGNVLRDQGRPEEAAEEYRAAVRLDPGYALPHNGLGLVLYDQGRREEAAEEFRAATRLDPRYASPHNRLGLVLNDQGRREEAAQEYRAAIRLDPKFARAYYNLGNVLRDQGKPEEAAREYQRALGLGYRPAGERLRQCDRLLLLVPRLSAVLKGDDRPASAVEVLGYAELCSLPFESRLAAAARFFSEAFAADPRLADDRRAGHRYNAARCAALAGCGQGKDADKLDDKEKARLRRQALVWLKAEFVRWARQALSEKSQDWASVRQTLRHWEEDTDLAGVRGEALAKLPEAEREAWQRLWDEVDALLANLSAPEKKP